jgi:transposase
VDLYLKEGMSSETVAKKLGIHHSMVNRWVKHFDREGMKGLEEKRGKAKGPGKGRPRIRPEDPETKIKRLEAEVEMLKKLLKM